MTELITPADLGRRGGTKTKEKYGSEYYRAIQRKSVEKRKKNKNGTV